MQPAEAPQTGCYWSGWCHCHGKAWQLNGQKPAKQYLQVKPWQGVAQWFTTASSGVVHIAAAVTNDKQLALCGILPECKYHLRGSMRMAVIKAQNTGTELS